MTITERDWERLETDQHATGMTVRRIYPESAYDIFIAVRHLGNWRMLTLRVPERDADKALRQLRALPSTRGLTMELVRLPDDGSELRVVLADAGLREVFNPLAGDIAAAAHEAPDPAAAVLAAVSRFEHWQRMLEKLANTGLTPEARRGLFGELSILRCHLLATMSAADAVAAWTGPAATNQDFQLPGAAIEVKTSAGKEPQTLVISNERELDPRGTPQLLLAFLSLDERRGGSGESLNTAVAGARAAVTDAAARSLLDDLLVRAGYLESQRDLYDEPRYTVRRERFWRVTDDFPRITEADLRPGVGDCRYRISTTGLDEYVMTAVQVNTAIKETVPVSDLTLEAYAQDMLADVLATAEAESTTAPETFTRRTLDDLEQAGVTENTFTAYYRAHGVEVSGYGSNDSLGSLDVFVSSFRQYLPDARMPRAEAETLLRRALTFIQRCRDGLRHDVEESSDVYDMCLAIEKKLPEAPRLRLFLLTNSITTITTLPDSSLDGLPVSYEIWDLARSHRMATSGTLSEPIVVEFDNPLPCLVTPQTNRDFSVFLTILPGCTLSALYGQYGTRLLELNVRSFLQAKGAVNRGIRDTLLNGPERFLAYNNGITATASKVEFTSLPGGGQAIRQIHDLQIVNGGQTTASIHYAHVRDKADVSGVYVQMKLTVVAPDLLQEIVPQISMYSNTQNKVTLVDFSSNHPFHVEVEKITRSLWAPAADGSGQETRWFYERARGQYADALARERTPARQRAFKTLHPLRQKFTKADAAKFEHSWDQLPHVVSRGAEKNFREFMIRLGDKNPAVDTNYCRRLIAKAILFRATEKIVSARQFGGYRANIVTYTIALLANETGQRIDLDRIWREQRVSPTLAAAIDDLCLLVHDVITHPVRVANVTEWAKRPECWSRIIDIGWQLPVQVSNELVDPAAVRGRHAAAVSGAEATVPRTDSEGIAAVVAVPASDWFAVARWAKETHNLQPWQRQIAFTTGQYLSKGWDISTKQSVQAKCLMEEAQRLGFRPSRTG